MSIICLICMHAKPFVLAVDETFIERDVDELLVDLRNKILIDGDLFIVLKLRATLVMSHF